MTKGQSYLARWTRRDLLKAAGGGVLLAAGLWPLWQRLRCGFFERLATVHISAVTDYSGDLRGVLLAGFQELGVTAPEIRGKRVLLKPNMVEPHGGIGHINTHPLVVRGAIEALYHLGAVKVIVGEGAGHSRDTLFCLEATGLGEVLQEDRVDFVDLNTGEFRVCRNLGNRSTLGDLYLPVEVMRADVVVSIAKMKTHHWAGVTLTMKNMFGVMPGSVYGWPKNVLHQAGIARSIYDINATVRPHIAIIDGIVGMEGDGPIMGEPVSAGVLVMGRNPAAVDATGCRLMGIDPLAIEYLRLTSGLIGTIGARNIEQRGENLQPLRRDFRLLENIPAQRGIRLSRMAPQLSGYS